MTIYAQPTSSSFSVKKGPVPRLAFSFQLYHLDETNVLYEPTGICAINLQLAELGKESVFLAHVHLQELTALGKAIARGLTNDSPEYALEVELTPAIVSHVDEVRKRSNLTRLEFSFEWSMSANKVTTNMNTGQRGSGRSQVEQIRQLHAQNTTGSPKVTINYDDWLKVMEEYGFPSRKIIEMVFPCVDREHWLAASQDLDQADRDFNARRDKQALDFCEQAFEKILGKDVVMSREDDVKTKVEALLEKWGVLEGSRRHLVGGLITSSVLFVRRGKHQASAAGHADFDPTSGEAQMGLLVTKSTVAYLCNLRG